MTRATLVRHDPWAGQPASFDRQTATVIYKAMAAMDEGESQLFGTMLLGACNNFDLMRDYVAIAKSLEAGAAERAEKLRRFYSRQAVAKQRRGEDNTHEIACLVEIGKAFSWSVGQRSQYAQQNAKNRTRVQGRFAAEHRQITTYETTPKDQDATKAAQGIPKVTTGLSGFDLSHYQQAYQQVRDMLHPYKSEDMQPLVHLHISHTNGSEEEHVVAVDPKGQMVGNWGDKLLPGSRVQAAQVTVAPKITPTGAAMMGLVGVGTPTRRASYNAAGAVGVTGAAFTTYAQKAGEKYTDNEPYSATSRAFGHLQRGTALLQEGLGENAPLKLQYALQVANHVGQFGPEAQKVIGPFADRTAYRYRGTERVPDRPLLNAIAALHRDPNMKGADKQSERRRAATYGIIPKGSVVTRTQGGHIRATDPDRRDMGWYPGPVLEYFHDHLPNPDLNELQRRSGVIPPSEGVIINREGKLSHQAVGYADDWYLPFNLKHLTALKGGDYIRTRSFGGPTTEDIYTGLISGARKLTVVSHNGVYNVEFDQHLRGGRRFNDKATRMVSRYGQLLDALRSGKVGRGDISGSRRAEIRDEMARATRMPQGSQEFSDELKRRVAAERMDPKLSTQERGAVAQEWLEDRGTRTDDGKKGYLTAEEMQANGISHLALQLAGTDSQAGGMKGGEDYYRSLATDQLVVPNDREKTIRNVLGVMPNGAAQVKSLDRALERARVANMERVHPLALNGTGYDDALHALQEQFPYYIHGVNFTPWTDAVGMADQAHRNTPDTGYVIPRHNRPEKAESGYFSTDVFGQVGATGSGKVKAHTTRYQNRRAHQNGPVAAQQNISPVRGAAGSNGTPAAAAPPSPFGPRIAANAGPPAQATTEEGMDAQYSADMDLLDHLHDQQTFKSGAKVFMDPDPNKGHGDMSGANIRQEIEGQQFPSWGDYPAFRDFYRADKGALQAALANPQTAPQVRGVMDKVVRLANGPGSPINIDPAFVSRFHAGGQAEAAKDLPENLQLRIAEMHHDHVFPDADPIAFYEHQQPTVEHISDTYVDDPLISALVDKGALPTNVDSAHFINQASAVEGEVRAGVERLYRQDRNGGQNTATRQALNDETEGLMRARQLRRRWEKARNRVGAPAPVWEEPAPIIQAVFPAGTPNTPEGMAPYRPQLEAASEAWQRQQRP